MASIIESEGDTPLVDVVVGDAFGESWAEPWVDEPVADEPPGCPVSVASPALVPSPVGSENSESPIGMSELLEGDPISPEQANTEASEAT